MSAAVARLHPWDVPAMLAVSLLLVAATALGLWPIGWVEVLGFISGGVCVWLIVREHPWTWPVGMLNNLLFVALFLRARLYADMTLQVLFFGLALYGWWQWLHGGRGGGERPVSRTTRVEWWTLAITAPLATWVLHAVLVEAHDAAPFADALTTVLCLAAQYLLTHKRIENWAFWVAADVIYVPMYLARSLPLTSLLYAALLVMCVIGWRDWARSRARSRAGASREAPA